MTCVFGGCYIAAVALVRDKGVRCACREIGGVQWALELPAGIVWVHIAVATFTWVAMLWSVAAAGRLRPREETAAVSSPERALEGAGV